MATDQQKVANRARMWGMVAVSMTLGIWDMVQESSLSISPVIGKAMLEDLEKLAGLEIAGEQPEAIMVELGRIFVDECGFATEVKVEKTGSGLKITMLNAVGTSEFGALQEQGVEKLFSHPFYCVGLAALARLGCKARGTVELDKAAKTYVITFELL